MNTNLIITKSSVKEFRRRLLHMSTRFFERSFKHMKIPDKQDIINDAKLIIPGHCVPKERCTPVVICGHAQMITKPATRAYMEHVKNCWLQEYGQNQIVGSIEAHIKVFISKPENVTPEQWEYMKAGLLRPSSIGGDVDNLAKSITDGLNKVAYPDDSLICSIHCEKFFTDGEEYAEIELKSLNSELWLQMRNQCTGIKFRQKRGRISA